MAERSMVESCWTGKVRNVKGRKSSQKERNGEGEEEQLGEEQLSYRTANFPPALLSHRGLPLLQESHSGPPSEGRR